MSSNNEWKVYTILYAESPRNRPAGHNFVGAIDFHDDPMPLDFFVWLAKKDNKVVLIDSGCSKETCLKRGHKFIRSPADGVKELGISPNDVTDIVVTHMHWDHLGNLDDFPNAKIHVHVSEMSYATGRHMCNSTLRRPYDIEQVCDILKALYAGRVQFTEQATEIAPGLKVHPIGGHTPGLQIVEAKTRRGNIVLASDGMHLFANAKLQNPYAVVVDIPDYFDGLELIFKLADSENHVIPGHDPLVKKQYKELANTSGIWDVSDPDSCKI